MSNQTYFKKLKWSEGLQVFEYDDKVNEMLPVLSPKIKHNRITMTLQMAAMKLISK